MLQSLSSTGLKHKSYSESAASGLTLARRDKGTLLCPCYIPPKDSLYYNPDIFSNLEHDINIFQKDYSVILALVLNARTGIENDFITSNSCNFIPGNNVSMPKKVPIRTNFDQYLNEHGKILLEMCKSLDIRILNGKCKGDSLGKITFNGIQGISTVDYVKVSEELLD